MATAEEAIALHDSLPEADTLEDVFRRRKAAADELARREAQHAQFGEEAERIGRDIERQERVLAGLLEADAKHQEHRDDRDRILRCSRQVRDTLEAFRREMIKRHLSRIERLVLDSYQQLLRKTSLVTQLSIDPQTFSLELHTRPGASCARREPLRRGTPAARHRPALGAREGLRPAAAYRHRHSARPARHQPQDTLRRALPPVCQPPDPRLLHRRRDRRRLPRTPPPVDRAHLPPGVRR